MVGKTRGNINRFEKGGEIQRGDDVVRIFLRPLVSNKGNLITQNELGREGMEDLYLRKSTLKYEKSTIPGMIEES